MRRLCSWLARLSVAGLMAGSAYGVELLWFLDFENPAAMDVYTARSGISTQGLGGSREKPAQGDWCLRLEVDKRAGAEEDIKVVFTVPRIPGETVYLRIRVPEGAGQPRARMGCLTSGRTAATSGWQRLRADGRWHGYEFRIVRQRGAGQPGGAWLLTTLFLEEVGGPDWRGPVDIDTYEVRAGGEQ